MCNIIDVHVFFTAINKHVHNVAQATETDADLFYLLKTLFLEQRSGLRRRMQKGPMPASKGQSCTAVDSRNANVTCKALMLRRALFLHLRTKFPQFQDDIDAKAGYKFYKEAYGVSEDGQVDGSMATLDDEEEEEEAELDAQALDRQSSGHASAYASRGPLIALVVNLAKNKCPVKLS